MAVAPGGCGVGVGKREGVGGGGCLGVVQATGRGGGLRAFGCWGSSLWDMAAGAPPRKATHTHQPYLRSRAVRPSAVARVHPHAHTA